MKNNKWIKITAIALSAALLCGCGGKDADNNDNIESIAGVNDEAGVLNATDYVTLGQYMGLELSTLATDKEVDTQTKLVYFSYVTPEDGIKDRAVELGDVANIDYEGKKDGVAFEGGTAQGTNLIIGSGSFIDGFEDGLIGVMPGETVDLNLTFPEYYGNEELAGQDVVFTVKVNFIAEMEDESVADIGVEGVTNVEELRNDIKDYLNYQSQSEIMNEIINLVMDNSTFGELPEELLARYRQVYVEIYDEEAANASMDVESYMEQYNVDYEELLSQAAENDAKRVLAIQAIADAEGISISDDELDSRLESLAQTRGTTVDELYTEGYTRQTYKETYYYADVMQYLMDNAVAASDSNN